MKRREFMKGSLALGLASLMPRFAMKKERKGMPDIKKYKIKFVDDTKINIEFIREVYWDDGTISFYAPIPGSTDEQMVLRVSPHNYLWMKPVN